MFGTAEIALHMIVIPIALWVALFAAPVLAGCIALSWWTQ